MLIRVASSIAGTNNGTNGKDALRVPAHEIHIAPGGRSTAVGHAKGAGGLKRTDKIS